MSCSLTVDAVRARTKTVTRRHVDTWRTLHPGDRLTLVEKAMGLPKGARQVVLAEVAIVSVRVEPIMLLAARQESYGRRELELEGFPDADPDGWVDWWCRSHGVALDARCRRIVWVYLDGEVGS